ncbi:hypothetical protein BZG02_11405 [Labilibaculum filiforme]|uniref:Gliding motility lipoprotein GldH n=2 Tax=Labilibaculum filiforme TaxID=1940526 RepID=A0A2N3HXX8_9BACT|nr:hypothetical protein BZG02_11405 [Labilibaculum filiforme]
MKMLKFLCVLFLVVIVLSCDSKRVYEQYESIPDFEWSQENTLRFEVEITDTIHAHNIFVNLRNSGDYAYSNLWVFVKSISPDKEVEEKKVEIALADETGAWYGSGFGDIFDLQVPFKKNVVFPKSGKYVFKIKQGMYDPKLKGIVNVGIRIEKGIR